MKLMGRYSKYWPFQQPGPLFRFCIIALSRLTLKVATPATSQFWLPKYQTGQVCQWRVESGKLLSKKDTISAEEFNVGRPCHSLRVLCNCFLHKLTQETGCTATSESYTLQLLPLLLLLDHLQKRVTHKRPDPIKSSLPGEKIVFMSTRIYTKLPSIHWLSPSPKRSALPWLEAFGPWKNSMKHFDHL